ncbi:Hypothetical predicted protein, partial [Podarcis lilfordi]
MLPKRHAGTAPPAVALLFRLLTAAVNLAGKATPHPTPNFPKSHQVRNHATNGTKHSSEARIRAVWNRDKINTMQMDVDQLFPQNPGCPSYLPALPTALACLSVR